jgi:hypothetical protein
VTILARVTLRVLVASAWSGSSYASDESTAREPVLEAFQIVPLLDRAKGNESVASYHDIVKRYCHRFGPRKMNGDVDNRPDQGRSAEHTLGFGSGVEVQHLELLRVGWGAVCSRGMPDARALASGSFTRPGADEVLLDVENGRSRTDGDHALALMIRVGTDHGVGRILVKGHGFSALSRIRRPGIRDTLFLCQRDGSQDEYRGTCGFFNRGSFFGDMDNQHATAEDPYPSDDKEVRYAAENEIPLRRVVRCGFSLSVEIGKVYRRADRLVVQLIVETLVPGGTTSPGDSGTCRQASRKQRRLFDIAYRLEEERFHRVTPLPPAVKELVERE